MNTWYLFRYLLCVNLYTRLTVELKLFLIYCNGTHRWTDFSAFKGKYAFPWPGSLDKKGGRRCRLFLSIFFLPSRLTNPTRFWFWSSCAIPWISHCYPLQNIFVFWKYRFVSNFFRFSGLSLASLLCEFTFVAPYSDCMGPGNGSPLIRIYTNLLLYGALFNLLVTLVCNI
jgi:hypothetical protein